jgi:hypothetical protein
MQNKMLYAYDKQGKFVGEYPTIAEAAKNFGPQQYIANRINQVLVGKSKTVKGYYVTYTCYLKLPTEILEYINSPNAFHYKEQRPVYRETTNTNDRYKPYHDKYMKYRRPQQVHQYDPKGDYMFSYDSIYEASELLNANSTSTNAVPNGNKRIAKAMNERTKTNKHYKYNGHYFSCTKYNNLLKQN